MKVHGAKQYLIQSLSVQIYQINMHAMIESVTYFVLKVLRILYCKFHSQLIVWE